MSFDKTGTVRRRKEKRASLMEESIWVKSRAMKKNEMGWKEQLQ